MLYRRNHKVKAETNPRPVDGGLPILHRRTREMVAISMGKRAVDPRQTDLQWFTLIQTKTHQGRSKAKMGMINRTAAGRGS